MGRGSWIHSGNLQRICVRSRVGEGRHSWARESCRRVADLIQVRRLLPMLGRRLAHVVGGMSQISSEIFVEKTPRVRRRREDERKKEKMNTGLLDEREKKNEKTIPFILFQKGNKEKK